jgi:hypothetical protein
VLVGPGFGPGLGPATRASVNVGTMRTQVPQVSRSAALFYPRQDDRPRHALAVFDTAAPSRELRRIPFLWDFWNAREHCGDRTAPPTRDGEGQERDRSLGCEKCALNRKQTHTTNDERTAWEKRGLVFVS